MSEPLAPSDFIDQSSLSYFVPYATKFNLEEALEGSEGSRRSALRCLERRESLFFGEAARRPFAFRLPIVPPFSPAHADAR
jgi:hypothetical protein